MGSGYSASLRLLSWVKQQTTAHGSCTTPRESTGQAFRNTVRVNGPGLAGRPTLRDEEPAVYGVLASAARYPRCVHTRRGRSTSRPYYAQCLWRRLSAAIRREIWYLSMVGIAKRSDGAGIPISHRSRSHLKRSFKDNGLVFGQMVHPVRTRVCAICITAKGSQRHAQPQKHERTNPTRACALASSQSTRECGNGVPSQACDVW